MAKVVASKTKIFEIPLSKLNKDTFFRNRRRIEVDDLKASIKSIGQQNPIVVRYASGGYQVISGFRRVKAIRESGLSKVKAVVYEGIDNKKAHEISIAENMARRSLTDLDVVMTVKRMREQEEMTNGEVARIFNRDIRTIQRFLVVANASDKIKKALEKGMITISQAYEAIRGNIPLEVILKNGNVSVRDLRRIASKSKKRTDYIRQKWFNNGNFNLTIYFKKRKHNKQEVIAVLKKVVQRLEKS